MPVKSRQELTEYCLRALGAPVININVDETQLDDRISEALELYQEYHFDATYEQWVTHVVIQEDVDQNYLTLPEEYVTVFEVLPVSKQYTRNMFDYRYQVRVNELSSWKPFDQVDYFMRMTNYNSVLDMLEAQPSVEFVRKANRLYMTSEVSRMEVGQVVAIKVQTLLDPEEVTKIYNDRWLKRYTTALFKLQWGINTKKFSGVTLLGGVEINGQQMYDEARQEMERLEEELKTTYQEPIGFLFG